MGSPYGQQPPAAATCASCGAQLDSSQRFCPACGQPTTGVAWQGGTMYQASDSGAQTSAAGPMVPPQMPATPPAVADSYGAAPSSPMNAGLGQPPSYPPPAGATPAPMPQSQPAVSGPVGQPYAWTNPLQPPYAAGQQAPYGQAAPTTGAPFTPGQTTYQTPQTPASGYPAPGYATPGYAAPDLYTPTYQSPVPPMPQRKPRSRVMAVIAAICIIAVLGAGAVFAYNILAAHTENQAAKLLPSDTFAYSALDLVAYANNSHNFNLSSLINSSGAAGQDAFHSIGLNFQTDISPWLGRDIAFAVFPKTAGGTQINQPLGRYGGVLLIQSTSDSAAQAAMTKVANYLRGKGTNITSSTYSSVPLYSAQSGDPTYSPAVTFGAGKGWAIIGLDLASAQTVIDRIDGKGTTLADNTQFQNAISDLPSDRYGTLYVNLRALVSAVSPGTSLNVPFINTYPVATGYTEWTSAGVREALTLKGNASVGNLAGDTKSLAAMVPSGALGYVGVANLSGLYQAGSQLVGTTSDPVQSDFGVAANNPALQQPVAYAYLGASGNQSQVLLLHLTSDSAGQSLIQDLASAHSWTTKSTTIAGQKVTAFYDDNPGSFLGNEYGYDGSNGPYVAGYAAIINSTLVVTAKDMAMQAVIQTAQGGPSLARDAAFSQLANAAPSGAAVTGYVNLTGISPALGSSSNSVAGRTTALLLTGIWNNSKLQLTADEKIS